MTATPHETGTDPIAEAGELGRALATLRAEGGLDGLDLAGLRDRIEGACEGLARHAVEDGEGARAAGAARLLLDELDRLAEHLSDRHRQLAERLAAHGARVGARAAP